MSKAEAGLKLVRWLPQIARATADEFARFGPQAARVRSVLDFLPTMSDDAARVTQVPRTPPWFPRDAAWYDATQAAKAAAAEAAREAPYYSAFDDAWNAAVDMAARDVAGGAASGEAVSDLIDPRTYRTLTNPLAVGRAFDVLRPRAPENFLDVVRGLGERGLVQQPVDVLGARTLARAPKSEREALMEVINAIAGDTGYADTGYESLAELIEAARLLG